MASTIPEPLQADRDLVPSNGHGGNGGNGGWKNLVAADGAPRVAGEYSPPPSSTAIWVVLFAITMMFAALSSALIVRNGASLDWQTFKLPSILYFNTCLLMASCSTIELAR